MKRVNSAVAVTTMGFRPSSERPNGPYQGMVYETEDAEFLSLPVEPQGDALIEGRESRIKRAVRP